VEHPTGSQPPSVGESSHAAEDHAESSGTANQHTTKKQREEPARIAEEPSAASGDVMGIVVVEKSSTRNPATEGPAVEAAVVEEEAEIEEIIRSEEENAAPQCVRIARKRDNEWVFYEEDLSDWAIHKLQRTVDDLMGQIKVRALETRCNPIRLL
jgi:hypothetical protein